MISLKSIHVDIFQERNVPSNIEISCQYIAETKKIDKVQLAALTTQNAIKLFPKLAKFISK